MIQNAIFDTGAFLIGYESIELNVSKLARPQSITLLEQR